MDLKTEDSISLDKIDRLNEIGKEMSNLVKEIGAKMIRLHHLRNEAREIAGLNLVENTK